MTARSAGPSALSWTLALPGSLSASTGGTIFDRRMVEGARAAGGEVDVIELAGDSFPRPGAEARRAAMKRFAALPDGSLVVVDGLALGALPELAAREGRRLRLIALVHHPLCDERPATSEGSAERDPLWRSEREALRHVAGIVVTSGFTRRRMAELDLARAACPVHVVEPGVDPAPVAAPWQPGEALRFLSVGSLTPRKAHGVALRALASLPGRLGPWSWTIVGRDDMDPVLAAGLRRAVAEHSTLSQRVHVTGAMARKDLDGLYRASHVLLHPAHYEGFGMAVTEALAAGIPVIASDGGALAETLERHGQANGRLAGATFEAGSERALASVLADLLKSPERWSEWAATAADARRKLQGWPGATKSFIDALRQLAD